MSLERITAASFLPPAQNQAGQTHGGNRPSGLVPGEMVQLTLDAVAGDELLATTMDGVQLRLAGLGRLAQSLAPGALLNLRVLATAPRLELAIPNISSQAVAVAVEATPSSQTAAMRVDQAALARQVMPASPDAAALASSWRAMAQSYLERHAMLSRQALELRLPATLLLGSGAYAMGPDMHAARPAPGAEQWPFAPVAFGSHRAMLAIFDEDDGDAASRQKQKRRRAAIALLLESILPGLGRILVRMRLAADGVVLDLYCEEGALALVRKLQPDIASAIMRAGLRLARCRLMDKPPPRAATDASLYADVSTAVALPSSLFRAAAEVWSLLASPSLPALVNRRCR